MYIKVSGQVENYQRMQLMHSNYAHLNATTLANYKCSNVCVCVCKRVCLWTHSRLAYISLSSLRFVYLRWHIHIGSFDSPPTRGCVALRTDALVAWLSQIYFIFFFFFCKQINVCLYVYVYVYCFVLQVYWGALFFYKYVCFALVARWWVGIFICLRWALF